jgi:hypothetical protein
MSEIEQQRDAAIREIEDFRKAANEYADALIVWYRSPTDEHSLASQRASLAVYQTMPTVLNRIRGLYHVGAIEQRPEMDMQA